MLITPLPTRSYVTSRFQKEQETIQFPPSFFKPINEQSPHAPFLEKLYSNMSDAMLERLRKIYKALPAQQATQQAEMMRTLCEKEADLVNAMQQGVTSAQYREQLQEIAAYRNDYIAQSPALASISRGYDHPNLPAGLTTQIMDIWRATSPELRASSAHEQLTKQLSPESQVFLRDITHTLKCAVYNAFTSVLKERNHPVRVEKQLAIFRPSGKDGKTPDTPEARFAEHIISLIKEGEALDKVVPQAEQAYLKERGMRRA